MITRPFSIFVARLPKSVRDQWPFDVAILVNQQLFVRLRCNQACFSQRIPIDLQFPDAGRVSIDVVLLREVPIHDQLRDDDRIGDPLGLAAFHPLQAGALGLHFFQCLLNLSHIRQTSLD